MTRMAQAQLPVDLYRQNRTLQGQEPDAFGPVFDLVDEEARAAAGS